MLATTMTNPYVGPIPFKRAQNEYFFGRDQEEQTLLSLVISERVVLFCAQSGVGKSSLVNARLIPLLEEEGYKVWPVIRVGGELPPGISAESIDNIYIFNTLWTLSNEAASLRSIARHNLKDFLKNNEQSKPHWLIFDQFEEILTTNLKYPEHRPEFFRQLRKAMDDDPLLSIIFVMREEHIAGLDDYATILPDRLRVRFRMDQLSREQAIKAVRAPAHKAGRPFDENVAEALVDDLCQIHIANQDETITGPNVEPFQLQIVCRQLWEKVSAKGGSAITDQDRRDFGDINNALEKFYEDAVERVANKPEVKKKISEAAIRRWFGETLITPTRIRAQVNKQKSQTGTLPNEAVNALLEEHLIREEEARGGRWIELAHDRLITPILNANKKRLIKGDTPLSTAAINWQQSEEDDSYLFRGWRLKEAEEWYKKNPNALGELERRFLIASRAAQNQIEVNKQRQYKIIRWLAVAAFILFLATGLSYIKAQSEAQNARRAEKTAREAESSAIVAANIAREAEAKANAVAAELENKADLLEAANSDKDKLIADATQKSEELAKVNDDLTQANKDKGVLIEELKNNEKALLAANDDIKRKNEELKKLIAYNNELLEYKEKSIEDLNKAKDEVDKLNRLFSSRALAADESKRMDEDSSPEEKKRSALITLYSNIDLLNEDNYVTKDGIDALKKALPLSQFKLGLTYLNPVKSLAFKPIGDCLASMSEDGIAQLRETSSGNQCPGLNLGSTNNPPSTNDAVTAVVVSRDGKRVAVGRKSGHVEVKELSSGKVLYSGREHKQSIYKLAFSNDGKYVATASAFSSWTVINVESRHKILKKPGKLAFLKILLGAKTNNLADAMAFSNSPSPSVANPSNRDLIAIGRDDGMTEVWDMKSNRRLLKLPGHRGPVLGAAFSPDNKTLVTSGRDAKSNIWDISDFRSWRVDKDNVPIDRKHTLQLRGHLYAVIGVAFSPDGHIIATASEDRTAKLWDRATGKELVSFTGSKEGYLTNLSFSHNGAQFATASQDKSVKIWEISSENNVRNLNNLLSSLSAIQFKDGLSSKESKDAILRIFKEVRAVLPVSLTEQDCQTNWKKSCSEILSPLQPKQK